MTRVLLADDQHLVRGALAALLDLEDDLEVVGQVGRGDEVASAVPPIDYDGAVPDTRGLGGGLTEPQGYSSGGLR